MISDPMNVRYDAVEDTATPAGTIVPFARVAGFSTPKGQESRWVIPVSFGAGDDDFSKILVLGNTKIRIAQEVGSAANAVRSRLIQFSMDLKDSSGRMVPMRGQIVWRTPVLPIDLDGFDRTVPEQAMWYLMRSRFKTGLFGELYDGAT